MRTATNESTIHNPQKQGLVPSKRTKDSQQLKFLALMQSVHIQ